MKRKLLVAGILVTTLLFGFKVGNDWYNYTSTDGKFSISFPSQPKEKTKVDTLTNGAVITFHMVSYSVSMDEAYLASSTDLSNTYPSDKTIKEILETSKNGATGRLNVKNCVVTSSNYVSDKPYIEFVFSNDKFVGKNRIYMINKVEYSIIYLNSADKGLSPDVDKFINSFKCTN